MTAPSEEQVRERVTEWLKDVVRKYNVYVSGTHMPHETQMAVAALALLDAGRKDRERVDWQEANPSMEVVSNRAAEDEEESWAVYSRGGSVNDTEWELVAHARTWRAAIDRARGAT